MALKMRKQNKIISDTVTVFTNAIMNKFLEKIENKGKMYEIGVPLFIYMFGESLFKKIKILNTEYLTANALEKVLRDVTKSLPLVGGYSKYIEGEKELDFIEAQEDEMLIEAELDDNENYIEEEATEIVDTDDNISYEIVE